jgi:predicted ATPase with chaperone activity
VDVRTLALGRLALADLKKDANGFDLPIALGLLLGSGQVALDRPGNFALVGELALTSQTRPVKGSGNNKCHAPKLGDVHRMGTCLPLFTYPV